MAAVKRSINRSIGEEGARAYDAKDYNALYDAQKRRRSCSSSMTSWNAWAR